MLSCIPRMLLYMQIIKIHKIVSNRYVIVKMKNFLFSYHEFSNIFLDLRKLLTDEKYQPANKSSQMPFTNSQIMSVLATKKIFAMSNDWQSLKFRSDY